MKAGREQRKSKKERRKERGQRRIHRDSDGERERAKGGERKYTQSMMSAVLKTVEA